MGWIPRIFIIFRYFMPLSLRKEVYDTIDVWQSEEYTSAEIARIYEPFPISGWIFSNPVFVKNQRLEYLPDKEPYEKPGHIYAVQLQEETIVVLDRLFLIIFSNYIFKQPLEIEVTSSKTHLTISCSRQVLAWFGYQTSCSESNTDWCRKYLIAAHQQILKRELFASVIIHS